MKTPILTWGELFAVLLVACLYAALIHVAGPWTHDATEIRLIGECDGKFYGAMEEDEFPAGYAWIEPIRFDVD
jgi:hypothetical protein